MLRHLVSLRYCSNILDSSNRRILSDICVPDSGGERANNPIKLQMKYLGKINND